LKLGRKRAISLTLASAALFGASTPLAKLFVGEISPLALAGLLYLGSGIGLAAWIALRPRSGARIARADRPWLAAAIAAGGVVAPALLMFGLARTEASSASLLLNLEAVFTAAIAWLAFRENVDRRVFLGMAAIITGGALLSWQQLPRAGGVLGPMLIIAACTAWALDNNLTRRVSGGDAATIACMKGLIAGGVNFSLALAQGSSLPSALLLAEALVVGFFGYGVSLALFIVGLRHLGTARTSAYFSIAPFFGAAIALAFLGEHASPAFWFAAALMGFGVWMHLRERHEHTHMHEPLEHAHPHTHDEHDFAWDGREPHTHLHRHERLVHAHPHYPDLHHRHSH
jgi:drug/metabolite transporter (DMT)-like permease